MDTNKAAYGAAGEARAAPKQAIHALESLESETQIQDGLSEIVGAYGKVNSISRLPSSPGGEAKEYRFLVDFDDSLDAMAASNDLKCYLLGFSRLMVSVPRHGKSLR